VLIHHMVLAAGQVRATQMNPTLEKTSMNITRITKDTTLPPFNAREFLSGGPLDRPGQ